MALSVKAKRVFIALLVALSVSAAAGAISFIGPVTSAAEVDNEITTSQNDQEHTSSDCDWDYDINEDGTVTIYGVTSNGNTDIKIPKEITGEGGLHTVVEIADGAFKGMSNIQSVEVPSTVKSIGEKAFFGCSALKTVTFDSGSELTRIGDSAFYNSGVTSIDVPASVESIGDTAFNNCKNLESVSFENGSDLKTVGNSAFKGCTSLEKIALPDGVSAIGSDAFAKDTELSSVSLPGSVTQMGGGVFEGCTALKTAGTGSDADIQFGWTDAVPAGAFSNASSIEKVDLPDTLTGIGDDAFLGCTSLEDVSVPDSVTSIGQYAFSQTAIKEIQINGVSTINEYTFHDCSSLTKITAKNATAVKNNAFYGCNSLSNITLADGYSVEDTYSIEPQEIDEDTGLVNCKAEINAANKAGGTVSSGDVTASNTSDKSTSNQVKYGGANKNAASTDDVAPVDIEDETVSDKTSNNFVADSTVANTDTSEKTNYGSANKSADTGAEVDSVDIEDETTSSQDKYNTSSSDSTSSVTKYGSANKNAASTDSNSTSEQTKYGAANKNTASDDEVAPMEIEDETVSDKSNDTVADTAIADTETSIKDNYGAANKNAATDDEVAEQDTEDTTVSGHTNYGSANKNTDSDDEVAPMDIEDETVSGNSKGDTAVKTVTQQSATIKLSNKTVTYNGKAVSINKASTNSNGSVTYTYYKDKACKTQLKGAPVDAGTYYVKATVSATDTFKEGTSNVAKLTIKQKAQKVKLSTTSRTFTAAKVKTANQPFALKATSDGGAVTFSKISGNSKITIDAKGNVTVKKGLAKGTYTVKVKVSASKTTNFSAKSITGTFKVTVK